MDRSCAIRKPPEMRAIAIRLRDGRSGDGVIAVALRTGPVQVPPLLRRAATKSATLLAKDDVLIDLTSSDCREPITQPIRKRK